MKRAVTAQPVKSIVTFVDPVCPADMVGTCRGSALTTCGAQAVPKVCARVKLGTEIAAPAGPLSRKDKVQMRAFGGPDFAVIFPKMVVVKLEKVAVMVRSWSMMTVVRGAVGSVTLPSQPRKVFPGVGVA